MKIISKILMSLLLLSGAADAATLEIVRPFKFGGLGDYGYCVSGAPNNFRYDDMENKYRSSDAEGGLVLSVSYQGGANLFGEKLSESFQHFFKKTFVAKDQQSQFNFDYTTIIQPARLGALSGSLKGEIGQEVTGYMGIKGHGAVVLFDVLATAYLPRHTKGSKAYDLQVATVPLRVTAQIINDPQFMRQNSWDYSYKQIEFSHLTRYLANRCPYKIELTDKEIKELKALNL